MCKRNLHAILFFIARYATRRETEDCTCWMAELMTCSLAASRYTTMFPVQSWYVAKISSSCENKKNHEIVDILLYEWHDHSHL